ncbi:MAG: transposase [Deltaproteobacteria bacterium]
MMYQVGPDDLVPLDNFYRRICDFVDFNFLYKLTAKYYGTEVQESIDPVVFFKVCIVGYLNNITSDRRLIDYCSNCLDIRLFLKYDIDEKLPLHSTISRTRQLFGEDVFLILFKQILTKCIDAGLVREYVKNTIQNRRTSIRSPHQLLGMKHIQAKGIRAAIKHVLIASHNLK